MITLHTGNFHSSYAQGIVRDIRVRWALEEAGIPYDVKILSREDLTTAEYRQRQPFGQIPVIEEDGEFLSESSSIVLYLGERSEVLLPRDKIARARAISWVMAAISSVEQHVYFLGRLDLFPGDYKPDPAMRPMAVDFVEKRLVALSAWLGEKDYLEDRFTAGDLVMASVLKMLRHTDLVAQKPNLKRYLDRCEARPAFQRAYHDHMAAYQPA